MLSGQPRHGRNERRGGGSRAPQFDREGYSGEVASKWLQVKVGFSPSFGQTDFEVPLLEVAFKWLIVKVGFSPSFGQTDFKVPLLEVAFKWLLVQVGFSTSFGQTGFEVASGKWL